MVNSRFSVRDPVLKYKVDKDWGRHPTSTSALYTHASVHAHTSTSEHIHAPYKREGRQDHVREQKHRVIDPSHVEGQKLVSQAKKQSWVGMGDYLGEGVVLNRSVTQSEGRKPGTNFMGRMGCWHDMGPLCLTSQSFFCLPRSRAKSQKNRHGGLGLVPGAGKDDGVERLGGSRECHQPTTPYTHHPPPKAFTNIDSFNPHNYY